MREYKADNYNSRILNASDYLGWNNNSIRLSWDKEILYYLLLALT